MFQAVREKEINSKENEIREMKAKALTELTKAKQGAFEYKQVCEKELNLLSTIIEM